MTYKFIKTIMASTECYIQNLIEDGINTTDPYQLPRIKNNNKCNMCTTTDHVFLLWHD